MTLYQNIAASITQRIVPDPWKRSTAETIERQAERLLSTGVSIGETEDVINSIVSAMRSEYGE